jgi:membrane-associated phospholipid phosphatase
MNLLVNFITHLGDAALLIPASALLVAYLAYRRFPGHAGLWLATLVLCGFLTLALKAIFFLCGTGLATFALRSPSGHTSLSLTFYGCAAVMASVDKTRRTQLAMLAAGAGLALAVALTRIALHAHTTNEVLAGLLIGGVCVAWFGKRYFALRPVILPWPALAAAVALLAVATHGVHWDFEWLAGKIAALLRAGVALCS